MIELPLEKRIALASLKNHPGYVALREAMELLFKDENGRLLSIDRSKGATSEQVVAAQDQARGYYGAFSALQDVIARCAEEREAAGEGEEDAEEEPEKEFVLDQDTREQARQSNG